MITVHLDSIPDSEASIRSDHLFLINRILKENLGLEQPLEIKPLSGGFSSPGMYKAATAGKSYVVRFSHQDWKTVDREREIHAMKISAGLGLAPKVLYADVAQGVVVMEYLPKQNPPAWLNMTDDYMQKLASRMRKLHEGPVFKPYVSLFDDIRGVGASLTSDPLNLISKALVLNDLLEKELHSQWQNKPCHNDLHPDNTLESGDDIFFIDWEEAGSSDPFRDLATYAMFCGMRPDKEKKFLTYYLQRPVSDAEWEKYLKTKRVVLIYYGFVIIMLSQKQGIEMPEESEISSLPRFQDVNPSRYFENGYTPDILRFAFICLKEAASQ